MTHLTRACALAIAISASAVTATAATCPTPESASNCILKGKSDSRGVMLTEGYMAKVGPGTPPGRRVQLQHPSTAMTAHAKAFPANERVPYNGVMCSYSNHVGVVGVLFVPSVEYDDTPVCNTASCSGTFWRDEYTYSTPEEDARGNASTRVCMSQQDGAAVPSAGCGFTQSL